MNTQDDAAPAVNPFKGPPITVPRLTLATLLDAAVYGSNFMSGWWDTEETDAAREVAVYLGVCPNSVTPREQLMSGRYPECEGFTWGALVDGVKRFSHHADHDAPLRPDRG